MKRLYLISFLTFSLILLGCDEQGGSSEDSEAVSEGAVTSEPSTPERTTQEETEETTRQQPEETTVLEETTRAQVDVREETTSEPPPEENAEDGLEEYGTVVTVSRVVDGDTIEVDPPIEGISDVRLIGVDTPETYGGVEPYGEEASSFTESALSGQQVALEFDAETIDPYGRILAYVWLSDGSMFNETLVGEGYAQVATFPPNVKYVDRFLTAQEQARALGAGLWGLSLEELCGLADRGNGIGEGSTDCVSEPAPSEPPPDPAPSQEGGVPPISTESCPDSHPIKGNDSSSGELIYHSPGGSYYDVTNPEECFSSATDAEAAGYRASQR